MNQKQPFQEPDTERRRAEEKRRREYERKFGYMQNIDGITEILPQMSASGIPTDVLGSYTGTGIADPYPVQDADDL